MKKKNSIGNTLIYIGILGIPMLIGTKMGASAARGKANISTDEIVVSIIVSALVIGLGLLINYLQKRREKKGNQEQR